MRDENLDSDAEASPGTVLVVDDDRLVAKALGQSLEADGLISELAQNVDEALAIFSRESIDVILTDLSMPGGSGLDLLRHIDLRDPMVPVIIITGNESIEAAAEAVRERAFDYLTKPVRREMLLSTIHRAVAARRQGRKKRAQHEHLRRDHERLDRLNRQRATVLSVLFNRAVEGIIMWDRQGHLIDASDSFVSIVDEPLYNLLNGDIDHLFEPHPSEGAIRERIVGLANAAGPPGHWRGDVTVRAAGGLPLPARLSLSVCEMPADQPGESQRCVVGLLYYERAHAELSRQLQQADRLATVGLLAGSAAHEIKNDLGPLLGYLSLLEVNDSEGMIAPMRESVRRIQEHIEQILAPLRPRVRTRGPVFLQRSLEEILVVLRRAGRLRRLELVVLGAQDVIVHADKDEIHQIVVNLITNALDALGDGNGASRGSISIRMTNDDAYGCLEVEDDGAGIPENLRARVFEPFFTTKGQGGTGLGLPVVHDIVRNLHGTVVLSSTIGKGTKVLVRIPLYGTPEANA